MRNFRTIVIAALLLLGTAFCLSSGVVWADSYGLDAAAGQAGLKGKAVAGYTTVPGVIGGIIKIALGFLGIVFFFLVLYAGFIWMTSMGSSEKVEQAKGIIEGAAIGLILVIAAYAIATFVFTSLESGSSAAVSSNEAGQYCFCKSDLAKLQPGDENDIGNSKKFSAVCSGSAVSPDKCTSDLIIAKNPEAMYVVCEMVPSAQSCNEQKDQWVAAREGLAALGAGGIGGEDPACAGKSLGDICGQDKACKTVGGVLKCEALPPEYCQDGKRYNTQAQCFAAVCDPNDGKGINSCSGLCYSKDQAACKLDDQNCKYVDDKGFCTGINNLQDCLNEILFCEVNNCKLCQ